MKLTRLEGNLYDEIQQCGVRFLVLRLEQIYTRQEHYSRNKVRWHTWTIVSVCSSVCCLHLYSCIIFEILTTWHLKKKLVCQNLTKFDLGIKPKRGLMSPFRKTPSRPSFDCPLAELSEKKCSEPCIFHIYQEKKEEIWLSPLTKAPTLTNEP